MRHREKKLLNVSRILFCVLIIYPFGVWSYRGEHRQEVRVLLWKGSWEKVHEANPGFIIKEKKFWYKRHAKAFRDGNKLEINLTRPLLIGKVWCKGRLSVVLDRQRKKISLVNKVALEEYVKSVLSGEVYSGWPRETVKTMSVAIRTYAAYKMKNSEGEEYDLRSDERSQVFRPGKKIAPIFEEATEETRGEILVESGQVILALYSASCGGASEAFKEGKIRYLVGKKQPYCKKTPVYRWEYEIESKTLAKQLQKANKKVKKITIIERSIGKRVNQIGIGFTRTKEKLEMTGRKFRELLGNHEIKSLRFKHHYSKKKKSWIFEGFGYGHGYGLCQWGSKTLGERGTSYKKILQKFYPGTKIEQIENPQKRERQSI